MTEEHHNVLAISCHYIFVFWLVVVWTEFHGSSEEEKHCQHSHICCAGRRSSLAKVFVFFDAVREVMLSFRHSHSVPPFLVLVCLVPVPRLFFLRISMTKGDCINATACHMGM